MGFQNMNTMTYFGSKTNVAQFVEDIMRYSTLSFQSITITNQEKLEGCFVRIATDTSWAVIDARAQDFSLEPIDI